MVTIKGTHKEVDAAVRLMENAMSDEKCGGIDCIDCPMGNNCSKVVSATLIYTDQKEERKPFHIFRAEEFSLTEEEEENFTEVLYAMAALYEDATGSQVDILELIHFLNCLAVKELLEKQPRRSGNSEQGQTK